MMPEISPLIRTRTLNVGYVGDFAVYPDDFSDADINWAISCVENVMSNNPIGVQRLVASKGDKKIAGFACRLSEFADKLLPEEKQSESKNYTYDKNGTNIPAFLGFAFTRKEVPNVTPSDIWRLFMKNLADKWRRNFVESIAAGYSEPETIAPEPPSDDEKLFRKYLAEAIRGDVAVIIENGTARKIPQPQPKAPEPPEKNDSTRIGNGTKYFCVERNFSTAENRAPRDNRNGANGRQRAFVNTSKAEYPCRKNHCGRGNCGRDTGRDNTLADEIIRLLKDFSPEEAISILLEVIKNMRNVFENFRENIPQHAAPTVKKLFEYEEHYMRLVKNFRSEIEFIDGLQTAHEQEVKNFYSEELPAIRQKLAAEPIADDVRQDWLTNLERHMSKSFDTSEKFIKILTTKKLAEFNAALKKKIREGDAP